jgi:hypothetical protein
MVLSLKIGKMIFDWGDFNKGYWDIDGAWFPLFNVPVEPIGTSLRLIFSFQYSNEAYWNIATIDFLFSIFQ